MVYILFFHSKVINIFNILNTSSTTEILTSLNFIFLQSTCFSCFLLAFGIMKKIFCLYKNNLFQQVLICSLQFPVHLVFPDFTNISFYARRSPKRKKTLLTSLSFFAQLGSASVKAARKTLRKLTRGGYLNVRTTIVKVISKNTFGRSLCNQTEAQK